MQILIYIKVNNQYRQKLSELINSTPRLELNSIFVKKPKAPKTRMQKLVVTSKAWWLNGSHLRIMLLLLAFALLLNFQYYECLNFKKSRFKYSQKFFEYFQVLTLE